MKTRLLTVFILMALLAGACTAPPVTPAPAQSEAPAATQAVAPEKSAATEPPAPTQPPAAEGEPVEIRVWTHQNDAFNSGLEALAEAYTAAHPQVTIKFETFDYDTYIQTLQTALPAKTEADILQMFGSWVCSYAEGGSLAEVPGEVISLEEAQAQIFEAQIAGYVCADKLYGLPQEFNIEYGAALVNTQIAEEAGLTQITQGWKDWDAFISDAVKLTVIQDDVMTRAGYNFTGSDGTAATFYSLILQNGGEYLTDEGFKVNTPEGQKALELMKRFVDEKLVDPVLFNDEQNWVGDSFFNESSAMGLVGPWAVPEFGADFPEVAAVTKYVSLPSISGDPVFVASSGWGLSVSANSKVQEAAWDFIKFATLDPANARQWNLASGTLPALKANAEGQNAAELIAAFPYFEPFLKILPYGKHEGHFPDRDFVWYEVTYPRVLEFLQGSASLEDTLAAIEQEVSESMK